MFLTDVINFHRRHGIQGGSTFEHVIKNLTEDEIKYRLGFLFEELIETTKAFGVNVDSGAELALKNLIANATIDYKNYDELEIIDGLLDLVYVSFGTLDLMELSEGQIREHQAEIQRANMSKERSSGADDSRSKRKHSLDIVKPKGWKGPNHGAIMESRVKRFLETANEK